MALAEVGQAWNADSGPANQQISTLAMASDLLAMASTLVAMVSNLLTMASNLSSYKTALCSSTGKCALETQSHTACLVYLQHGLVSGASVLAHIASVKEILVGAHSGCFSKHAGVARNFRYILPKDLPKMHRNAKARCHLDLSFQVKRLCTQSQD